MKHTKKMGDLLKDITPRYSPPRRLVHPGSLLTQGIRSPRRFATYKGPLLGSRSTRSSPPRHRQGPRPRCRQGSGPKLHQGSGPTRRQGPGPGSCRHPGLRPGVIAQDPKKTWGKVPRCYQSQHRVNSWRVALFVFSLPHCIEPCFYQVVLSVA